MIQPVASSSRSVKEALPLPAGRIGRIWRYPVGPRDQSPQRPHRHDELELNLVLSGGATYEVDGVHVVLRPGDGLLLWPRHTHALIDQSRDFAMWIVVVGTALIAHACTTDPGHLLRDAVGPVAPLHWRVGAETGSWLYARIIEMSGRMDDVTHSAGLAHVVLAAVGRRGGADPTPPAVAADARRLVDEGTAASWTLPRLAHALGTSPSTLTRAFRAAYGVTVLEYRHQVQLTKACQLYRQGAVSTLAEAAAIAGFGSYAQFHRVFRSHRGCSPREHARSLSAKG